MINHGILQATSQPGTNQLSDKKLKLFMNGRSQAVRLPADFRFQTEEVYIRRDPASGEVILSPRPGSWDDFFAEPAAPEAEDFLADRGQNTPQKPNLF